MLLEVLTGWLSNAFAEPTNNMLCLFQQVSSVSFGVD
jgi:hypothetical protein